jgi:hypothetical protein
VDRVGDEIVSLPAWYARLAGVLAPSMGASSGEKVASSRYGMLNLRVEPLNLRAWGGIPSVLLGWEDAWRDELRWEQAPFRGSAAQTVDGCARFLSTNWLWAADSYTAVADFAAQVHRLVGECRLQVEGPSGTRQVGVCPVAAPDGYVCGTALYAHPYVDVIECRGCRARWERPRWIELATLLRASKETA